MYLKIDKILKICVKMLGLHNMRRNLSICTRAHFQGAEDYDWNRKHT